MPVVISTNGRRYDRNVPPPLPANRMLTRKAPKAMPMYRDFREFQGPIKDQGQFGSCTGHAGTSDFEWTDRRYFKNQNVYAPLFTYVCELLHDGSFPNDEGSTGTTLCDVLITKGACLASVWPDDATGQIVLPNGDQYASAKQHTMGAWHGVTDSETAVSVLGDPTPWPILIGFSVPASFESEDMAVNGWVPLSSWSGEPIGGHEVCACAGYDVGSTPVLRPQGCPPSVFVQNSWSASWGLNGNFWMPLEILDRPDTDLKLIHEGKPWKAALAKVGRAIKNISGRA